MNARILCRITGIALVSVLTVFAFVACKKQPAGEQQGQGSEIPNKVVTTTTTVTDSKPDPELDIPLNDVPQGSGSTTTKKADATTGTSKDVTTTSTTKATTTTTSRPSSIELPDDV